MKRKKNMLSTENTKKYIKPTKKKVIITVLILAAAAAVAIHGKGGVKKTSTRPANEPDIVTRGDIDVTITGSASIQPYERFEIIPKVSGDIIYCPYDIGDHVEKGDRLYGFDSSDADLSVERQRISLKQSENNYRDALEENKKLSLKAKNSGVISDLTIKAGQDVSMGTKIASVNDTTLLEVELPFTQAQINSISIGDTAVITSSKHMSSVTGTVIHKATAPFAGSDGTALYNVTVSFTNPGAFYAGMSVGGSIGGFISPGSGVIQNDSSGTIISETEGTVSNVYYQNGDYVTKGTVIATITSDTVSDKITNSSLSYRSAALSMEQTEKTLDDFNITSPISGTVITKNSKAGDTIDKTNSSTTMMVIADISKLKFDLAIDELDVSKVTEGLEVAVTCDALPGEKYTGYITSVSVEGSSQNGVTTYTAEVVVDEPGNLRPSMNIDATVIIQSARDVLLIPTADVRTVGGKSFVFIKDDENRADDPEKDAKKPPKDDKKPPKDGNAPSGASKNIPAGNGDKNGAPSGKGMVPKAPDGYRIQEVVTGISNEDYTEIISGLSEGQEIYSQTVSSSSSNNMMGGMGFNRGGMSGGGMPGGGMPPSNMGARGGMGGGMR